MNLRFLGKDFHLEEGWALQLLGFVFFRNVDSKYSKHSVHRKRVFLPAQGEHGAANCPERRQKAREKLNVQHLQCIHDIRTLILVMVTICHHAI